MAKILFFDSKETPPFDHSFLVEAEPDIVFHAEDGSGARVDYLHNIVELEAALPKDTGWSNQDLADLYRVERLLSEANIAVETDRGSTDEGDPWFVFFHISGEVFVHICRIDGTYILDSPALNRPLRGANFKEIIDDFIAHSVSERGEDQAEQHRQVIELSRYNKVRLHPSAMLAALIWTVLLMSDELHAAGFDGSQGIREDEPEGPDVSAYDLSSEHPGSMALKTEAFSKAQQETVEEAKDLHSPMRDGVMTQGGVGTLNSFTIGLSTIAVAMGMFSELRVLAAQNPLGADNNAITATQNSADHSVSDKSSTDPVRTMLDQTGIESIASSSFSDEKIQGAIGMMAPSGLFSGDNLLVTPAGTDQVISLSYFGVPLSNKVLVQATEQIAFHDVDQKKAEIREGSNEQITLEDQSEKDTSLNSLITLLVDGEDIQIPELVKELYDKQQVTFLTPEYFEQSEEFEFTSKLLEFNDMAQKIIDFFHERSSYMAKIEHDGGVIYIDSEAMSGGDVDYMHWERGDGAIISLVGLQEDFQQFDMIA